MGKSLRELRKESNLATNVILYEMNIQSATLYAWERGDRLIPINRLYHLLKLYNQPIETFDFDQLIERHEGRKVVVND